MSVRALGVAMVALVGVAAAVASAEPPRLDPSEIAPFLGAWSMVMTNPAGSQQTVRVWNDSGAARASLQIGKFPPRPVTGILKDDGMLVLTLTVFENGKSDRAVIALTRDGDTMNMAQMLEFSQTIKRGSGKKTDEK